MEIDEFRSEDFNRFRGDSSIQLELRHPIATRLGQFAGSITVSEDDQLEDDQWINAFNDSVKIILSKVDEVLEVCECHRQNLSPENCDDPDSLEMAKSSTIEDLVGSHHELVISDLSPPFEPEDYDRVWQTIAIEAKHEPNEGLVLVAQDQRIVAINGFDVMGSSGSHYLAKRFYD